MNRTVKSQAATVGLVSLLTGLAWVAIPCAPASATELVLDGDFEGDATSWTVGDSVFGAPLPLCTVQLCGFDGAHAGNGYVWFGGAVLSDPEPHKASISQEVTIAPGAATLSYFYWNAEVSAPFDATLTVSIDDVPVKTHTEAPTAEEDYSRQEVDVSASAGGTHILTFDYFSQAASGLNSMFVDDISLTDMAPDPQARAPRVLAVTPGTVAAVTEPQVLGTAEVDSKVTLYPDAQCVGDPLGAGSFADFAVGGIAATVPANATTTIYAQATKPGRSASDCSSTHVDYTHDDKAPASPTALSVSPVSPNASLDPAVTGTAEAGSTVRLYAGTTCVGTPVATGTAAAFSQPGLRATVAAGSTTTFRATATDQAGNVSPCSSSSVVYTQATPATAKTPDTRIVTAPKPKIVTGKRKVKVAFAVASSLEGSTFECSIDGSAFKPCGPSVVFKLARGRHAFAVRAAAAGTVDPTPANYQFKITKRS